jgi:hypothetical protein
MDKIKNIAANAAFYQDATKKFFRINICAHDHFRIEDEDNGEEYQIKYSDVNLETDTFFEIVPMNPDKF